MKLEGIEIDEEKLKVAAMDAALQVAKGEIDKRFDFWHSSRCGYRFREQISNKVDEVVSGLLVSDEFKKEVESFCRGRFLQLAEEKIANTVARTSVSKLKGS